MTNSKRPRHPGQDDRRDGRQRQTKTDPDRAHKAHACAPSKTGWKSGPE